jgi:hypothetical protein
MSKSADKMLAALNAFLEKKVRIEGGREDAKATKEEVEEFYELVDLILREKYEPSYKEQVPIEVTLTNRSTHHRLHYLPLPYDFDDPDGSLLADAMTIATRNLNLAAEDVNRTWRIFEMRGEMKRAKDEGRYCRLHGPHPKRGPCPQCEKIFEGKKKP